jgi:hypothetical protein
VLSVGKQFVRHVLPGVIKPIRVLWNELIAFVFVAFGVVAGFSTYRAVRDFSGDADSLFRVGLTSIFALIMLFFGVMSFLRARKISRS